MNISRRNFIKGLTVFGASMLTGSLATSCAKEESKKFLLLKDYNNETALAYIYEGHKNDSFGLYLEDNNNVFGRHYVNVNETCYIPVEEDELEKLGQYFDGKEDDSELIKVAYRSNGEFKTLYCDKITENRSEGKHLYTFYKNDMVIMDEVYCDDFMIIPTGKKLYYDPYTTSEYGIEDQTTQITGKSKQLSK